MALIPPKPSPARSVTLTVFIEGTANPMDSLVTQIALFADICQATMLDEDPPLGPKGQLAEPVSQAGHYKLCFAGCGVIHGLRGTVFAHGLRDQCTTVRRYIESFLTAKHTVMVNFVGLSRGGIGGLYLAQELARFSEAQVRLNMLLFDPVPGNFIWISRFLDLGSASNANLAMDISHVRNLGRVVVLYPHEPLPAIAVHAPLIPRFPDPQYCQLQEDVILGCHQGALQFRPRPDNCLSFALIHDFLVEHGSKLDKSRPIVRELDVPKQRLEKMLADELRRDYPTQRDSHAYETGTMIVRHSKGQFLCHAHQELLRKMGKPCALKPESKDIQVGSRVQLCDSGKFGYVAKWLQDQQLWGIKLDDGENVSIEFDGLELVQDPEYMLDFSR